MKEPKIRKIVTNLEEVFYEGGAEKPVETNSGRKSIKTVSVAAVIKNPYAGQWVEDLSELTEYGEYLGDLLTKKGAELLGAENVETYGKGCIVGLDGELEHSSAMLHPKSGKTIRAAIGGGKSIIPSNEKVGPAGSELDISLHFKDAAFVRTHYGSFAVRIPDAPKSDEIVMAVVLADAGRPHARRQRRWPYRRSAEVRSQVRGRHCTNSSAFNNSPLGNKGAIFKSMTAESSAGEKAWRTL